VSASRVARHLALAFSIALPVCGFTAAPAGWEPFTAATWKSWTVPGLKPAAVVFTTTDCEHCPAVIAELRQRIESMPQPRPLLRVVVTDAGNLTPVTSAARWYAMADERRVFEGNELAVRYAISPRWRGETPFVALLSPRSTPSLFVGHPAATEMDAWSSSSR
jgi:hypothetical protein